MAKNLIDDLKDILEKHKKAKKKPENPERVQK